MYNAVHMWECGPLSLFGSQLQHVQHVKYLGILVADEKFKGNVEHFKAKFFRAFQDYNS